MGLCESTEPLLGIEIPISEQVPPNCVTVRNDRNTKLRYFPVSPQLIEFFSKEADVRMIRKGINYEDYEDCVSSLYAIQCECQFVTPAATLTPEAEEQDKKLGCFLDDLYFYLFYKAYSLIFQGKLVLSIRQSQYVSLSLDGIADSFRTSCASLPSSLQPELENIDIFLGRLSYRTW